MRTENIQDIIKAYLDKPQTQYALLINGGWGSGKTFFWKKSLVNVIESKDLKPMYISLNGVNSIEKLEQLIFIELIPKLGSSQSDIVKNLAAVSKNIANATSKFFFKSDLTDIAKGTSIKAFGFKKYCICFDDLERCKIPIDELFGYLADFIEHKSLKCIVLADEDKIKDQETNRALINGYDIIKEKIIGRVLNYDPELETIIPILIETYKNESSFYDFLKTKEDYIISVFKEQKIKNLRIVNFYLECIQTIYPTIKTKESQYITECLFLVAIFSIEFKQGKLQSKDATTFDDFKAIDANWYSRITSNYLSRQNKDEKRIKTRAELFYEKYLTSNIDKYHFYPSLYYYVLSGHFNKEIFKSELKVREPEVLSDEIIAFRRILDYKFRELDDEDFARVSKKVYDYAKKGVYWMYDYKQIANFFFYFSDKGLIKLTKEKIEKDLLKGLSISGKRKEIHEYTYTNLMHFKNENPETQIIVNAIKTIHQKIKAEEDTSISLQVIKYLKNENKVALATLFTENKLSKELLQYLDVPEILKLIPDISNDLIFVLSELFRERYDYGNPGEHMHLDLLFLEDFHKGVVDYYKHIVKTQPLRRHNVKDLISSLEKAIKKIKATMK
ncbi:P-loop NTPase fold protein [Winogradskyella maritima]|uniref:P-loop NTPase fold protein n=1 Tax=Winogradskyella maritima TaxID=1517766 RepID=A0ABV8AFB5_9FLAO|nr:P-loop NTPase fold protein [Winogradskyella maritima]